MFSPSVLGVLARVATFAIDGVQPFQVWVEVDIRSGLPAFTVVGLGDTAVRESRDRIRSAILNSGFKFPEGRITANLAPAFMRKAGPGFDAALALAVLAASAQVPAAALAGCAVFGELSLGGELRDSPGALAVAEGAQRCGCTRLIVPRTRAHEAALVENLRIVAVASLRAAADVLAGGATPSLPGAPPAHGIDGSAPDLSDIRGHAGPLLALEIAAAGGHNLLLEGAPGTGKTMLARRLPTILPPLTRAEAIEVTRIHSVAGVHAGGLLGARPFRAPHHTISPAGLAGGGCAAAPGRGDPRPPGRALPRRVVGVPALQPRRPAPAPGGRHGDDRARAAVAQLPHVVHARGCHQPVSMRLCGSRRSLHLWRGGSAPPSPPAERAAA